MQAHPNVVFFPPNLTCNGWSQIKGDRTLRNKDGCQPECYLLEHTAGTNLELLTSSSSSYKYYTRQIDDDEELTIYNSDNESEIRKLSCNKYIDK